MADHFIAKTRLDHDAQLAVGGEAAVESHARLASLLSERLGPAAAGLFAEPLISRGNDTAPATVSWYGPHAGEGQPLTRLDGPARDAAELALMRALAPFHPVLRDAEAGPLVGAALHVPSLDDVWVFSGAPVILNWGRVADAARRDPRSRADQYQRTLGRFLPLPAAPPVSAEEQALLRDPPATSPVAAPSAAPAVAAASVAPAAAVAAADSAPATDDARPVRRRTAAAWVPLALLLGMAAAVLVWLLLPGTRLFPPVAQGPVTDARAAALAEDVNRTLIERRDALQAALAGASCRDDGTLVLPGGRTIEGLLPPDPGNPDDAPGRRAEAVPDAVLTPDPARVEVAPEVQAGDTALEVAPLIDVIEERTVIVLAGGAQGNTSTGSGFFVGPNLVVTNHHVIDGAERILVTNDSLASVREARLLKSEGSFVETGRDFALLRVEGDDHAYFTLHRPEASLKLQNVVAAGYPGDVLATDVDFAALIEGDRAAVPGLTVTDGIVNTEQELSPRSRLVVHSAPISQGNSGGPLIDLCGRAVGVNTFVRQGELRNLNFALSIADLVDFLQGTPARASVVTASCRPAVRRPQAPVAAAAE